MHKACLLETSKFIREVLGTLRLRLSVATCYPSFTNHLSKINKIRYTTKITMLVICTNGMSKRLGAQQIFRTLIKEKDDGNVNQTNM